LSLFLSQIFVQVAIPLGEQYEQLAAATEQMQSFVVGVTEGLAESIVYVVF
jgi:hypothetical protein